MFHMVKKMVHAGRFPNVDEKTDIHMIIIICIYIYNIAMENGQFIEDV